MNHIDKIFLYEWISMFELISYIESINGKLLGQGYFSKVYNIDGCIIKINCGDSDLGYMAYKSYFDSNYSIHAPICYRYRTIKIKNSIHYIMMTEYLKPFPYVHPEPLSISLLRESLKSIIYDKIEIFNDNFKLLMTNDEFDNIKGIYSFFKNFNNTEFDLDICIDNIKLRNNIWILNDPLTKIIKL